MTTEHETRTRAYRRREGASSTMTTKVTIRGKEYEREIARVSAAASMGYEDHGCVAVVLPLRYGGGMVQHVQLTFSPKLLRDLAHATLAYLQLSKYPKDTAIYALLERGIIVGLQALECDGDTVWLREDTYAEVSRLRLDTEPHNAVWLREDTYK